MHDLEPLETVRVSLRRTSGCRALIRIGRFAHGWWCSVDTGGPGIGSLSTLPTVEQPLANRHNAIMRGLVIIRNHWARLGVAALVEDVQEAIEATY